jgi:phospholipase C
MTNPTARQQHLKDTADLYNGIQNGDLPAVSHPASSKLILFEGFVKKIVDAVQAHKKRWNDTAIFITFDEGSGYWDSGYVQELDFFGDGTRIPMIVVSKYSQGGHISHTYTDHVSTAKFIEANWGHWHDLQPEPRQSAKSGHGEESLYPDQLARYWRYDGHIRF